MSDQPSFSKKNTIAILNFYSLWWDSPPRIAIISSQTHCSLNISLLRVTCDMMYKNLQNISFKESGESCSEPSIYGLFTYVDSSPKDFPFNKTCPRNRSRSHRRRPAFPTQVGSGGITRIRQDLKGNTKRNRQMCPIGVERNCQVFFFG